jgi:NADPH:quinone reductase
MHAVVLRTYGPPGNLRHESVPDPVPGPGQVLIAVRAAGVHLIETMLREGRTLGPPVPELPAVFGSEVAGVVESVGPGVDPAWTGRRVVTSGAVGGGYAELTLAAEGALHAIPEGLGFEAAATMIVTGATTVGVLDAAPVVPGDLVLVLSAAGGIGALLLQHARAAGATTIGAAGGPAKVAAVGELGADLAVDYDRPGWEKTVRDAYGEVTVVYDGVGGERRRAAFELLAGGGRQVVYGDASRRGENPAPGEYASREVTLVDALGSILARPDRRDLETRALDAAANGTLTPAFQTFPLREAAGAHAALESRGTSGKVLLIP